MSHFRPQRLLATMIGLGILAPGLALAQNGGLPADVDPVPRISFRYDAGMRFGLTVVKDASGRPVNKKLTYADGGDTNDHLIRVDGQDFEFGGLGGKWLSKNTKITNGSRSVWSFRGIEFAQILEIVPSSQPVQIAPNVRKRLLDTCLVRYEIVNKNNKNSSVGMRVMIDTLIGNNDGVPFAVPTQQGLVDTFKDFSKAKDVPTFVQALEVPNLKNPGTVGLMTFKLPGGVEAPDRVSLTLWPGIENLAWEVPLRNMGVDSCVVMYWNARALKPNEKRTVGFAYGLGQVTAAAGNAQLALTANGSFLPGGSFTLTAYVQKPVMGQTLTLDMPKGLELVMGKATEMVPLPRSTAKEARDTSTVTWTLKAAARGIYQVRVRSSTGASQTHDITVRGE